MFSRKTLLFAFVAALVYLVHKYHGLHNLDNNMRILLGVHLLLTLYLIHTHRHNENFKNSIKRIVKF